MIRTAHVLVMILLAGTTVVTGCGRDDAAKKSSEKLAASDLPDKFWLKAAPAGARPVAEVREKAKTGDKVVVAGIVGGAKKPFVDGAAVFTIVDGGEVKCTPDECEAPWDFCCVPSERLAKATVVVEFHENGAPIKAGARGFHGLDHMKNVVVAGEAKRDAAGNVIVVATGVFVES